MPSHGEPLPQSIKGGWILRVERVVLCSHDERGKHGNATPRAAADVTFLSVGIIAKKPVCRARKRCMRAADRSAPTLVEAKSLIVDVANLAAPYPLCGPDKVVWHACVRLLNEKHDGQHAVTPYDK
jgi:hypothetical protein